jgi:hypothetical protein
MTAPRRPIPPTIRYGWVPHATSAVMHVAVAVSLLVLRVDFLKIAGRIGLDPAGQRMCSLGAVLVAAFTAFRGWVEARKAIRLYREGRP